MASLRERALARTPPAYRIRERAPDQGGRETTLSIERRGAADRLVPIINGNGGLPRAHQGLGRQTQQEFDHWMHPDRNIEGLAGVALPGRSGRSVCGLTARPTPTATTGL